MLKYLNTFNMKNEINTKVLPGFMELLPEDQILFDRIKGTIQTVYEQFGFFPLDTPAIERAEVLMAKAGGETEKQIYSFSKGDNQLALRFDLTVPLARYVSEHVNEITFPFRRYHIAKVYRGESPQKGRYREFYQCDIDIIGNGSLSLMNDAEIPSVIYTVFSKLGFGQFVIKISNRKLITGLLSSLGIENLSVDVMRIIDKIDKVGKEAITEMLVEASVPTDAILTIFKFIEIKGSNNEVLSALDELNIDNDNFKQGLADLKEVISSIEKLGVPNENYQIDLSIARGLDYYTGTVYETTLVDYPQIGSICSGGRYDNLAEKYTDKKLPGVGISIGLTRLFSQLKDAGVIKSGPKTTSKVLVIPLISDMSIPLQIATTLRSQNIPTEIYLEDEKMKDKLSYANKLGIPYVILIGEDEIKAGKYALKNMLSGEQKELSIEEISSNIY